MSSARRFVHHSSARFSGGMSLYLRTDQSELHQFCFFICQRRIHFLNCRVGHFLYFFLRATIVIFTDRFIFQQSFYFIVRITTDVTNGDTRLLRFATDNFRQIFTTFFGQRRQRNANIGARRA